MYTQKCHLENNFHKREKEGENKITKLLVDCSIIDIELNLINFEMINNYLRNNFDTTVHRHEALDLIIIGWYYKVIFTNELQYDFDPKLKF